MFGGKSKRDDWGLESWILKKTYLVGLLIVLIMNINSGSLAGASPVLSTEFNQDTFIAEHNESITFTIYSSIGTAGSIFINKEPDAYEFSKFKVEVTSKTSSGYELTVTPFRPLSNFNSEFNISTDSNGSNAITLRYVTNLDLDDENLYTVNGFSLDCGTENICHVQPDITGDYPDEWAGQAKIEFRTRAKGTNKWSSYAPVFDTFWDDPSELNLKFISTPTEVAAKVTYRNRIINLITTIKPTPKLSLSAPGSAIVGFNFTVLISGPKSYSGTCSVNGFKVAVKNGAGKIALYGKSPGNLRLWMVCNANSNWGATSQGRDIYIRN
jgi:hypothetical protein